MNKNTLSLALLLSTVAADGNVELGAHLGASGIGSFKPCTFKLEEQKGKEQDKDLKWGGKPDLKVGFAGRLSLGYVESIENGVFYGIHTFVGWENGQYSNRKRVGNEFLGNTPLSSVDAVLSVKQSWNTGLYGQIGKEHENHRFFGIVGWTLSRFCVSSSLSLKRDDENSAFQSIKVSDINPEDLCPNDRPMLEGSKSQWRNGLSLGAGYAYKVSPKTQIGLTYVATWFPGTFSTQNSLDSRAKENMGKLSQNTQDVQKIKNAFLATDNCTTSFRSLWNHAIYLSVSMALNKSAA